MFMVLFALHEDILFILNKKNIIHGRIIIVPIKCFSINKHIFIFMRDYVDNKGGLLLLLLLFILTLKKAI